MSVINTNITSMIGQQNLRESQNSLQTSMERLSSGLRINSAKDDAAGQAIANRMTAQINGLGQAQRNANDGISIAQTAEGGLNQINDNLQRVRELTVQAANGTNSQADLQSIQDEVDQRLSEIDRISKETDFNGTRVLSENAGALTIQVGSQDNQTIDVQLATTNAESLNLSDFRVAADQQATVDDLVDDFNGQQTAFAKYDATGELTSDNDGTTAGDENIYIDEDGLAVNADVGTASPAAVYKTDASNFTLAEDRAALTTEEIAGSDLTDGNAAPQTGWTEVTQVNTTTTTDGEYTATLDDGRSLTAKIDGSTEAISYQIDGTNFSGDIYATEDGNFTVVEKREQATEADLESSGLARTDATYDAQGVSYDVDIDGNATQSGNDAAVYVSVDSNTGDPAIVAEGQQRTATDNPLEQLDAALNQVDSLRSELGAVQNRFEDAISNLNTNQTNLSDARSRIEDADYAMEVADMTRAQILQQAGTSVLAQANQLPQNVLSLLG